MDAPAHHRDTARPVAVGDLVRAEGIVDVGGDPYEAGAVGEHELLDVLVFDEDLVLRRGEGGKREKSEEGAMRGFMMVSMGRMVILGWISLISMIASE